MNKLLISALIVATFFAVAFVTPLAFADKPAKAAKQCNDGIDNDGDDLIDYPADPGCKNPADNDEYNAIADSCTDTDGGNYIYTFGTAYGYYNDQYYSDDDYCVDSGTIMEYYCNGDYETSQQQSCGTDGYTGEPYCNESAVYQTYRNYYCFGGECDYSDSSQFKEYCEYGCTDGECNSEPVPDSCSDTDGGNDKWIFGTTSGYYNNEPYENDDYCVDYYNIMEYYCSGDYEASQQHLCGTNGYEGDPYCAMNATQWYVAQNYRHYYCEFTEGECKTFVEPWVLEWCEGECENGECL